MIGTPTRWCVVALLLFPFALLAVDRSFVYAGAGLLDPWVYAGYHAHFASMWHFAPGVYYGTRVPYTALGSIIYSVAGAEPSLYILALLQLYAASFSLFFTIQLLFRNSVAGFIAACLLATNSTFLWAIGWKYIDGPSIVCMFLSFAALSAAARARHWRTSTVLWGAAMAGTAALYVAWLVLLPVEIVAFILLNALGSRRPARLVALLLFGGMATGVVLMGLLNWGLGGPFNFFQPTLALMFDLASPAQRAQYYAPWHTWIWSATWLLYPAFAALASIVLVAVRGGPVFRALARREPHEVSANDAGLIALATACILAVGGFTFMQLLHFNALQIWYHENMLWPFAFLVFGGCLATGLARLPSATVRAVGIAAPVLCLAPWVFVASGWLHVPLPYGPQSGSPANSLLLPKIFLFSGTIVEPLWMLAGAGLLVGVALRRTWLFPIAAIAFLSMISIATIPYGSNVTSGLNPQGRDQTLSIYDLSGVIDANRGGRPIFFWWNVTDPDAPLFRSLGEMYASNPFEAPTIVAGERAVILSSDGRLGRVREDLAKRHHLRLFGVSTKHVQHGPIGVDVAIADLAPARAQPDAQPLVLADIARIVGKAGANRSQLRFWWASSDPDAQLFAAAGKKMMKPALGDRVVVLTSQHADNAGKSQLLEGEPFALKPVSEGRTAHGGVDVAVVDVALDDGAFEQHGLPLAGLQPQRAVSSGAVRIQTPAGPWEYGATLRIPQQLSIEHPGAAYIRVRVRVDEGILGVGATAADGSTFIDRQFFSSSAETREVYLAVPALKDALQIVFCNGDRKASSSGLVSSIEIAYLRKP